MTEVHKDGRLDLEATGRHLERCMAAGCDGMITLATTGENSSLRAEETNPFVSRLRLYVVRSRRIMARPACRTLRRR